MARASAAAQTVLFICDAAGQNVPRSIYVAGGNPSLGEWVPNKVPMRDDGLEGDSVAGDGLWTLRISLPAGTSLSYKYTNSGPAGVWMPGDEFPGRNRTATIPESPQPFIIRDTFGR